ncbi:hypothetical protein ACOMHN_016714 [Nucella lapillus]
MKSQPEGAHMMPQTGSRDGREGLAGGVGGGVEQYAWRCVGRGRQHVGACSSKGSMYNSTSAQVRTGPAGEEMKSQPEGAHMMPQTGSRDGREGLAGGGVWSSMHGGVGGGRGRQHGGACSSKGSMYNSTSAQVRTGPAG